jgi:hypothetical protein
MLSVIWISGKRDLHDAYGFGSQKNAISMTPAVLVLRQSAISMVPMV